MLARFAPVFALTSLLSSAALAKVELTANVKDGDVISGEFTFKIGVQSESLVTSVEFYVDKDLRDTDESTPYEFSIDTLKETQGAFTVTFAAYTKSGESAKKTFKLTVDNGLDKGAAFHVSKGEDALVNGKWDDAIDAARVALKIDPKNNPARIVMARANLGKGVIDLAERYADDAYSAEPKSPAVLSLVSTVNLKRAFMTMGSGGNSMESAVAIGKALKKAAEMRRTALDMMVDSFGNVTDGNRMAYCDTLLMASKYSRVAAEMEPVLRKDFRNTDVANRLIYAQIRAGRFTQALQSLENIRKYGSPDGFSFALRACLMSYLGDKPKATEAEKEAILDDPTGLGVKTAQAYLALRGSELKAATSILTSLANQEGHNPVVNYDICALAFVVTDFDQSRIRFETAMLAEPASYDTLVERGNQAVYFSLRDDMNTDNDPDYAKRQRALARAFFEAAQAAKPESFEAMTGLCALALLDGRKADAVSLGRAATAAAPEYAAAQWAYAAAQFDANLREDAKESVRKAEKIDPEGLSGKPYPTGRTAWEYFFNKGRIPLLITPGS
ncbi:MAG: hypothetical protein JSS66_12500 [Armatimonadetes bacterium]|nr:hypothetical protein [Armatimonadota bacterium]